MSEHKALISWKRETQDFQYDSYNRSHGVRFEGGQSVQASAAPAFKGDAAHVNPEEMLVGSLSSCHMLTFLAFCAKEGLVPDSYVDDASGILEKNAEGKMAVTKVTLRPKVEFMGGAPSKEKLDELHERAHRYCMIANSVKCEMSIEHNF